MQRSACILWQLLALLTVLGAFLNCSTAMIQVQVLLALLACQVLGVAAQGPTFPYYDNCRRDPSHSSWTVIPLRPAQQPDGTTKMCFQIHNKASCTPEQFPSKGETIISRCCNTVFAKIKLYVDPACRAQFSPGELVVPSATRSALNFKRFVAPTWTKRPPQLAEVKFTQFGVIPANQLDGTNFCLNMKPGPCQLSDFTGIANPVTRAKRLFQIALYDKKKDGYECCPTFTFPTAI